MSSRFYDTNFKLNGVSYSLESLLSTTKINHNYFFQFLRKWTDKSSTVELQTSGSTGVPKTLHMSKSKMILSAKRTGAFLNLQSGNKALCCLPLDYIAGKMMVVRALVLGLDLYLIKPSKNPLKTFSFRFDFVAFTPYQLEHSIQHLDKIKTLIVGGGPINEKTKKTLYKKKTNVYETYGMTETVSHVALKHVSQGEQEFNALKGVRFETKNNCLKIFCDSILTKPIITNDVVNLISEKRFVWKGRVDFVINSGAIKIYPEELEKKLSQAISVPFVIMGVPDEEFGEKITIVFEGETPHNFKDLIEGLDFFEKPKKVFNLDVFPRNNNKVLRRKIITKILKLYGSN